jgi:hypothetical protein
MYHSFLCSMDAIIPIFIIIIKLHFLDVKSKVTTTFLKNLKDRHQIDMEVPVVHVYPALLKTSDESYEHE